MTRCLTHFWHSFQGGRHAWSIYCCQCSCQRNSGKIGLAAPTRSAVIRTGNSTCHPGVLEALHPISLPFNHHFKHLSEACCLPTFVISYSTSFLKIAPPTILGCLCVADQLTQPIAGGGKRRVRNLKEAIAEGPEFVPTASKTTVQNVSQDNDSKSSRSKPRITFEGCGAHCEDQRAWTSFVCRNGTRGKFSLDVQSVQFQFTSWRLRMEGTTANCESDGEENEASQSESFVSNCCLHSNVICGWAGSLEQCLQDANPRMELRHACCLL